jgi:glycine betaine transporter
LFQVFLNSLGDYIFQIIPLSFRIFSFDGDLTSWTHDWTLTYFIWWLAWGPFVGIFIARISRGRTIRQFVTGVIIIPSVFSMLWFAAFGGAALHIELFDGGGLADAVFADVTNALFVFFSYFPATGLLNALAVFLTFVFLVTSADSGTYVLAMMTSNGSLNPTLKSKMFWGIMIAVLTVSVIVSGSIAVAKAMAITGAIPFVLIVIMQVVGFLRVIRLDPKILENTPKPAALPALNTNKAAA